MRLNPVSRRARSAALLLSVLPVLAACGGGLSEGQQDLTDYLTGDELTSEGLIFDADCVSDLAAEVPDEDAAAMVAEELEGEDLSAEAQTFADGLFGCLDIDAVAQSYEDRLDGVEADCIASALEEIDPEGPDSDLFDALGGALFSCQEL